MQDPQSAIRNKVMVLGVDGATLDLILPWAEAGLLPTFARLMRQGSWGVLRSVVPPVSPTAWSSFLTGTNPGRHGVYDFIGRRPRTYENQLANASYRSGASLWGLLSQAGRRVTVFNVPLTYPVEPVNGLFVSGLMTPADATDATWPPELLDDIRRAVPEFNFSPPGAFSPGEEARFVQAIADLNETTRQVARYLLTRQPWDFFMAVFMGADIICHFLWKQMAEARPAHLADAVQNCYRQIDAALGELIEIAGPETHLIVMSDHGFGPLERQIHLNSWLLERGYLALKSEPATRFRSLLYRLGITRMALSELLRRLGLGERLRRAGRYEELRRAGLGVRQQRTGLLRELVRRVFLTMSDVDWSRTRLFSIGFAGPLYVNLKGRDPHGIVAPGAEYEALLAQVTADLRALRDPQSGEPLIGPIYRREELYQGPRADEAPDLILMPRDEKNAPTGMLEFASRRWLTPVPERTGTHRMDGILFLAGPGIRPGVHLDDSSIVDVAPTVLALLGQPIPTTMDGHVLEKAMTDELRASLEITRTAVEESWVPGRSVAFDDEEEALLRERLRGLGYVA